MELHIIKYYAFSLYKLKFLSVCQNFTVQALRNYYNLQMQIRNLGPFSGHFVESKCAADVVLSSYHRGTAKS